MINIKFLSYRALTLSLLLVACGQPEALQPQAEVSQKKRLADSSAKPLTEIHLSKLNPEVQSQVTPDPQRPGYATLTFQFQMRSQNRTFQSQAMDPSLFTHVYSELRLGGPNDIRIHPQEADTHGIISYSGNSNITLTYPGIPYGKGHQFWISWGDQEFVGIGTAFNLNTDTQHIEVSYRTSPLFWIADGLRGDASALDLERLGRINWETMQTLVDTISGKSGTAPNYTYALLHPLFINTPTMVSDLKQNNANISALDFHKPEYRLEPVTISGSVAGLVSSDTINLRVNDPTSRVLTNMGNGVYTIDDVLPRVREDVDLAGVYRLFTSVNGGTTYTVQLTPEAPFSALIPGETVIRQISLVPATPTLSSLSPGRAAAGVEIILNGTHFHANADGNVVKFGEMIVPPHDIHVISPTQLRVKVPTGIVNTTTAVSVQVGSQISNTQLFNHIMDTTPPALEPAYFRSIGWEALGEPDQIMLRFGLGSVMQANVNDSGGSGLDFASAEIALYDLGPWNALYSTPVQINGTMTTDGHSRIYFVPNNSTEVASEGHKYQSTVSIRDKAGNVSNQTAEWFRDDIPPTAPTVTHIYDPSVGNFLPYTPGMSIGGQPIKIRGILSPRGNYRSQPPNGFNGYSVVGSLHEHHWTSCTVLGGVTSSHGSTINESTGEYTIDYPVGDPNYIFAQGSQSVYVDSIDTAQHRSRTNIVLHFSSGAPPVPNQPSGYNGAELRVGPSLDFPMIYPTFSGNARASDSVQTICIYQADFYSFPTYNDYTSAYKVCQQVRPNGQTYSSTAGYDIGDAFVDINNNWTYDAGEMYSNSVTNLTGYPTSNGMSYYLPNVNNVATPLNEAIYIGIGSANNMGESVKQRVARLHYNTGLPHLLSIGFDNAYQTLFTPENRPQRLSAFIKTAGEDLCLSCHGLSMSSSLKILNHAGIDISGGASVDWHYMGSGLVYKGDLNISALSLPSGSYYLQLDLRDQMLNQNMINELAFKVDSEPPTVQFIEPTASSGGFIHFTTRLLDPLLDDGSSAAGVDWYTSETQADPYRVLGLGIASHHTTLTASVHSPLSEKAVDHRGSPLPVGQRVQVWDVTSSDAPHILGMPHAIGNSTASNAHIIQNKDNELQVELTQGQFILGRNYAVMYGLPHNDDLDLLQSHYLTTILDPVNAPGAYQLRVTAQDQAGNKQTVMHEVNISP